VNASMPYLIVPCQAVPDLSDQQRLTYALVLGLAWGSPDGATPPVTVRELAELRGLSPRSIDSHLAALRRAGYIRNAPQREGLSLVLIPRPLPGVRVLEPAQESALVTQGKTAGCGGGSSSRSLPALNLAGEPSSYSLLVRAGVYPSVAINLSQRPWITPELVQAWVEHLRGNKQVRHLGGLLTSILRRGDIGMPPPLPECEDEAEVTPQPAAAPTPRERSEANLSELGYSWPELLAQLQTRLPEVRLDTWLADSYPLAWDGRCLTIATRSWLAADYLTKRNTLALDQVLREFTGRPITLRFTYGKRDGRD